MREPEPEQQEQRPRKGPGTAASRKARVHQILESAAPGDFASRLFDYFLIALILLSTTSAVLRTMDTLMARYEAYFTALEVFAVAVFTCEYVLRLWSCTADRRYEPTLRGRLRYAVTPLALVDLMAFLPFYVALVFFPGSELAGASVFFRLLRLFKLFRYSESLRAFAGVFWDKRQQLVAAFSITLVLLIFSSGLVYYAEREAQPEAFPSIPAAMWWGIVTLTTVGYGDISPVTPMGKLFGAITAVMGIGLVALPSGILASGFIEQFERSEKEEVCPHCGKRPGDPPADA